MKSERLLFVLALLPALATGCATARAEPPVELSASTASASGELVATAPPNVLLILVDDLRPDLGIYGHPTAQTPNMDALGREGMVFRNAITQQAVCGPSRAALMTAIRPESSGITDLKTPVDKALPNAVTMLDLFRDAGYRTSGFGKIYHHHNDDKDGWTERHDDREGEIMQVARKSGEARKSVQIAPDRDALGDTQNVRLAIQEMGDLAQTGDPFLLAVGIHRPHLPFRAPQEDWDRYTAATVPDPVNPGGQRGVPDWAVVAWEIWGYDDLAKYEQSRLVPEREADAMRHGYLAAVSYADGLVGELMEGLRAHGLDQNTIVVLWGDHGWKLGDQGGWAKHSNVDLDIRIPLIVRAPGMAGGGTQSAAMVETVDIYPTLADLAGIDLRTPVEGISFAPVLSDPERVWKNAAFASYGRFARGIGPVEGRTVRTQQFRYTAWIDRSGRVREKELFDLNADPTESQNVANDSSYAEVLGSMENLRIAGWRGALPGE